LFELNTETLVARQLPAASALSRYPEVSRDLAIVVGVDTAAGDIAASIRANAGSDLTELTAFDVYDGAGVGEGKKSIAFGLTWQHPSRTLSDTEISATFTNCIKVLESDFKAKLRT
jgi:phenylalanyl-tRNA synthetase beta chain